MNIPPPQRQSGSRLQRSTSENTESKRIPTEGGIPHVQSMPHFKKQALLVEDSTVQGKMQRNVLQRLDYECDLAPTVSQAIRLLKEKQYDVIVTDHNINTEAAGKPEEVEYVRRKARKLFPKGMPAGCEEGILLLEYIKQKFTSLRRSDADKVADLGNNADAVKILISAFDGEDKDRYNAHIIEEAHKRGAHFLPKIIRKETLSPLLNVPFKSEPLPAGSSVLTVSDPETKTARPALEIDNPFSKLTAGSASRTTSKEGTTKNESNEDADRSNIGSQSNVRFEEIARED
jgi:CheY-like chemotaxis protein